jgi:hypothetical protein
VCRYGLARQSQVLQQLAGHPAAAALHGPELVQAADAVLARHVGVTADSLALAVRAQHHAARRHRELAGGDGGAGSAGLAVMSTA